MHLLLVTYFVPHYQNPAELNPLSLSTLTLVLKSIDNIVAMPHCFIISLPIQGHITFFTDRLYMQNM